MTNPSTEIELRTSGTNIQVGAGHMQTNELALIEQQANMLAESSIVPRAFKNRPADIFAVASIGREVGLSPMASMQSIHIIEGKPTMSAQLMGALVRARGHSLQIQRLDDDGCKMVGVRADTGDRMEYEFTKQHASAAGLMGKQVWKAHFRAMSLARCTSQIARNLFGDVLAGISYTPEEGADIAGVDVKVDAEGEVVEIQGEVVPTRVVPVASNEPPIAPQQQRAEPQPGVIDETTYFNLVAEAKALDAADAKELQAFSRENGIRWGKTYAETGITEQHADMLAVKIVELQGEAVEAEVVAEVVEEVEPVRATPDGAVIPPNPVRSRRRSSSAA